MSNIIAHIRPFAFEIEVSRKLLKRHSEPKYLGIYDMEFKEFKKKHKNDWPEASIQDYSTRNKDTKDALLDFPGCREYLRNQKIEELLDD